jgi:glucokinase
MYWDGNRLRPFATEGGHTDFAPTDEREHDLLTFLQGRYGHVSWERVVSGMGIANLYAFLRSRAPSDATGPDDAALGENLPAAVAAAAADGSCPLCADAMALFARLYGREAGNAALKHLALGGVYLGGGIAPKNLELLRRPDFLHAFFDKGRMEPLMRRMPVKVILEPHTPLYGAAAFTAGA